MTKIRNFCVYSVIIGVRLVKLNHVTYIQIQQGKILPKGEIDYDSIHWKDVKETNDRKTDENVFVFDYNNFRGIYLGESEEIKDQVLTGLKIEKLPLSDQFYLALKKLTIPYNYTDGNIKGSKGYEDPYKNDHVWDQSINEKFKKGKVSIE